MASVDNMVEKIAIDFAETLDEFIFTVLFPYCEDIFEMKITKQELSQALLKQKPQKVVKVGVNYGTPFRCPVCESDITPIEFYGYESNNKFSWCDRCGQKLQW